LVTLAAQSLLGAGFPYGTLAVNVVGSFLIGMIMHVSVESTLISDPTRVFLTAGVMGGLTTYSAFNYETLRLAGDGEWLFAAANLVATVVMCLVAGVLGLASGRALVEALVGS
jgi:CrcB protein